MKGLAAVARLELLRCWTLLPLALAIGLVPFAVMPLLGAPFGETRGMALLLALLLAVATALLLGATTLSSDLAAGRLGFYFSRPLAWWAIWGGKLATAFALTLAGGFLVLLPSLLFAPVSSPWPSPPLLYGVSLGVAAIGLAHWGAVAARTRSAWIALDVIALPLVVWALADAGRRILEQGFVPTWSGLALLFWPIALAIHAAGAVQVAQGRTSARRSHAAASLTGWILLALLAGGWQAVSRTAFRAGAQDVDHAYLAMTSPSGDTGWFGGRGHTLGFRSMFAESFLASPHGIRHIGPTRYSITGFAFSGDATHAAWLRGGRDGLELSRHHLASGVTRAVVLRPPPPPWPVRQRRMLADEDARRVALLQEGLTSVYDATTGERLALLEDREAGRVEYLAFREGQSDLVYRAAADGGLAIEELAGATSEQSGHLDPPAQGAWLGLHVDGPGERLLATGRGEARLAGARSGETLASFAGDPALPLEGLLLSDGRILIAAAGPAGSPLRLHDASGTLQGEVELGAASAVQLVETRPGRVVAAASNPAAARSTPDLGERLVVVDLDPLRVLRVEEGLVWRPARGPWLPARRDRLAGTTLLASRVLTLEPRPRAALLRYDVETGQREWVAGAR